VNIKLKKNKNTGFFGKLGLGYGTDKKYSGDGMISLFSPLTQISLVGASNNNNIMVNDVGALMRNSSFKGVGVSIEYQPDFSMAGLNKSNSGGFNFQHDFIPDASNNKNNRIDASYFMNDYNSELNKNTQTTIRLNGDSNLVQKSSSVGHTSFLNQKLNTNYNLKTNKIEFYASQSLELNKSRNYSSNTNVSETSIPSLQSTNNALYNQNLDNQNFSLKAGLRNGPDKFKVDYAFSINSSQDRETNQILFISPFNSAQNDRYDRNYDNHLRTVYNELKSRVDFKRFLFGDRKVYDIGMEISNSLKINNDRTENNVKDRDTAANQYKVNTYLSNINRYQTVDEMPALSFSKMFIKVFTNRFRKSILLSADIQEQFFNQQNISEKQFQNFNHSYTSLLPAADITYTNDQFGDHLFTYKLNYNTSTGYPTVYQRAPLIDSANIYYQQRGNTTLKPFYKKEIAFTLSYISFQAKNLFDSYTINIQAGSVQNSIGDSTLYDNLGRATNYSVNLNGVRYLNANGDFYKAFKLQTNQLQISGNAKLSINNQPKYINGALNQLNNLFSDNSLSLLYTYKETIALKVTEAIALYKSRQRGDFNNELNNSIQKTILSASVNLPQNITFSSNITFNKNTSSYVPASSFNIWNASVMYRFLKGNQGEVKFSALDLLHQNTNIINYGINNSLTTGSVNVLKQYFMLTVAYYPRKFGKAKKKGD
jgi:hypothetical protein